jgi:hypothetical protein
VTTLPPRVRCLRHGAIASCGVRAALSPTMPCHAWRVLPHAPGSVLCGLACAGGTGRDFSSDSRFDRFRCGTRSCSRVLVSFWVLGGRDGTGCLLRCRMQPFSLPCSGRGDALFRSASSALYCFTSSLPAWAACYLLLLCVYACNVHGNGFCWNILVPCGLPFQGSLRGDIWTSYRRQEPL